MALHHVKQDMYKPITRYDYGDDLSPFVPCSMTRRLIYTQYYDLSTYRMLAVALLHTKFFLAILW